MTVHGWVNAAILLLLAATAAGIIFLADYIIGAHRAGTLGGTGRAILVSAAGITTLVAMFLLAALLGAPDWAIWPLFCAVGILALVMFPWWQARLHRVRRTRRDVTIDTLIAGS